MRSRLGAPKAITATAHKLAKIFYTMVEAQGNFFRLIPLSLTAFLTPLRLRLTVKMVDVL